MEFATYNGMFCVEELRFSWSNLTSPVILRNVIMLPPKVAWYPDNPSKNDQTLMVSFFSAVARFYPCTWCAADFAANLNEKPAQVKSREELCVWLCEQHNHVNQKLGKPIFKCDMKALDERWRKSSNSKCQSEH